MGTFHSSYFNKTRVEDNKLELQTADDEKK